jgi:hypothetical protein
MHDEELRRMIERMHWLQEFMQGTPQGEERFDDQEYQRRMGMVQRRKPGFLAFQAVIGSKYL